MGGNVQWGGVSRRTRRRSKEEEELEEAERRKPWLGELASSSYSTSTRETNAHLDTIAEDLLDLLGESIGGFEVDR